MSIDRTDIARLLAELSGKIEGARFENAYSVDGDTVILRLRTPNRRRLFLLFSTSPGFSRFHLVASVPECAQRPTPFVVALKSALDASMLEAMRQVGCDRIVELVFAKRIPALESSQHGDPSVCETPPNRGGEHRLIQEIREMRGNLVLLGPSGEIVSSLHPVRRKARELGSGDIYEFPPPPERTHEDPGTVALPVDADAPPEELAGYPFHAKLALEYERRELRSRFLDRKTRWIEALRRSSKRRAKALEAAKADLAAAEDAEELRKTGERLKAAFPLLKRGMDAIEVDDIFQPGRTVRIELDPALGPAENVARYFHRYRKLERARSAIRKRIGALERDLERLSRAEEAAEIAEGLEELEAVAAEVRDLVPEARPAERRKSAVESASGPRRFLSADGHEILVARNAKGNEELTFRIGRGNDIFLHVSGRPGPHVVVRTQPGKTASLETLFDAAQLALYFSLPKRSRGELFRGTVGEVDYTPLKYVRKAKGASPGTVLLSCRKTLRVRLDPERLERLLSGREDVAN